jgi:predicted N-acetyltransferase YhbS
VTGEVVLEILDLLEGSGVEVWVDGGWGVDALLGYESRAHDDLDVVVALERVGRIRAALGARGFVLVEEHLPVRFVLGHPRLGRVDFHTVSFDEAGGGVQPQPYGGTFRYPPEGFTFGRILDRRVRCVSAEVQVLCHMGYEPGPKDAHDVLRLHRRFAVPLPPAYARFLDEDSPSIRVRTERDSDHERVAAIHEAAFGRPHEARLVAVLRAAARPRLSLVAEIDGRIVGHVFFSPVSIDAPAAPPAAGLAPVGVDPPAQGRGVGSALIREGLRRCPDLGWQAVFLVGNPAYYARFGFVLAAPLGLRYRSADYDRVFQVIELGAGALRGGRGQVHLHGAFDETGTA